MLWGHKLEAIEQGEDSVTVTCANGVKETFSFVIGCDGLHSNTRICIFDEQPASYTGLTQVCRFFFWISNDVLMNIHQWGGLSPRPQFIGEDNIATDIYGNGCGMIIAPIDTSLVLWA